jgi:transposase
MSMYRCPGAAAVRGTPTLETRVCPNCGAEIEIFSIDKQVTCSCGFTAYNDTQTCINWCKYAKDCVGEEMYNHYRSHSSPKG